jgi:hypothetical protein
MIITYGITSFVTSIRLAVSILQHPQFLRSPATHNSLFLKESFSTSQPALSGRHAKSARLKLPAVDPELRQHHPRAVQRGISVRCVKFFRIDLKISKSSNLQCPYTTYPDLGLSGEPAWRSRIPSPPRQDHA